MYAEYLRRLLSPLGVYSLREGSISAGMLSALGEALDGAEQALSRVKAEASPMTAEEEGLSRTEALFPFAPAASDVEDRRSAVSGFLRVSGDGFTLAALRECLCACGMECNLQETSSPLGVTVSFPGVRGVPEAWERRRRIIESILPCHLEVTYLFRWCTWKETERLGLTWGDLAGMTWGEWAKTEAPAQA